MNDDRNDIANKYSNPLGDNNVYMSKNFNTWSIKLPDGSMCTPQQNADIDNLLNQCDDNSMFSNSTNPLPLPTAESEIENFSEDKKKVLEKYKNNINKMKKMRNNIYNMIKNCGVHDPDKILTHMEGGFANVYKDTAYDYKPGVRKWQGVQYDRPFVEELGAPFNSFVPPNNMPAVGKFKGRTHPPHDPPAFVEDLGKSFNSFIPPNSMPSVIKKHLSESFDWKNKNVWLKSLIRFITIAVFLVAGYYLYTKRNYIKDKIF